MNIKNFLRFKDIKRYILPAIILSAALFRLCGVNWDQNQHLHPDERFLTMVTTAMKWPTTFTQYLDPQKSQLNPYNIGFDFYVYGLFPLTLVKIFSNIIRIDVYDYHNIALIGRVISAFFDLGIVYLIYKIAERIFNNKTALLASFIYSISVLPIQLSHFFTVDTTLVFFITLGFYILVFLITNKRKFLYSSFLGISFGLALASKISALLFLPIILISYGYIFLKSTLNNKRFSGLLVFQFFCFVMVFFLFSYFTLRIADPRMFATGNIFLPKINSQFINNLNTLKSFDNPQVAFPPAVQWLTTKPIIFPLENIIIWGLGLPLGITSLFAIFYASLNEVRSIKRTRKIDVRQMLIILMLFWVLGLFFYQAIKFAKTMRYFYPIYPFLAIITANFIYQIGGVIKKKFDDKIVFLFFGFLIFLFLIWPLSFVAIYTRPHSRVIASEWIYRNIPGGSVLTCEHWDDCLPLTIDNTKYSQRYKIITLEMYNPDSEVKWNKINYQLKQADYIILSSNRLWGSIPKVPEKYPRTSVFYEDLFAEKLGFTKVAEITSYPTIPVLNIPIPDDSSEEAFTVYDHPKVFIFKKSLSSSIQK